MMLSNFVKAERISASVVANMADLVSKLCEDEPEEVQQLVRLILRQRLTADRCRTACFLLPGLDDC